MNALLIEASQKLIELASTPEWKNELLEKAPPVLWFGNNKSSKKKILTLGANPSREEFLSDNKAMAQQKINAGSNIEYLFNRRFYHLKHDENYQSITTDDALQNRVIESYNSYFQKNPYKWFGKKSGNNDLSYNVEGFLNAINASFFEGDYKYQALHIDLFPFATISDFNRLKDITERDLIKTLWMKMFLEKLIKSLTPDYIVVFGRANLLHFKELFHLDIGHSTKFHSEKGSSDYWLFKTDTISFIGLSVNLGNPIGFTKKSIHELGKKIIASKQAYNSCGLKW